MNWMDDILSQDIRPLNYYRVVILNFMADMAPTHATIEPRPAGYACLGGGSKNGRKKEKSKKLSLSALNAKLYIEA